MDINVVKSTVIPYLLSREEERVLSELFHFHTTAFEEGIHYLKLFIKPNAYQKQDWAQLLEKLDKRLKLWCHRWLSRAGRLVLVKSVLEAIPVYWMTLAQIPKGILEKARRICFRFLWRGKQEAQVTPWVRWGKIAVPKGFGGWGLKKNFLFAKSLEAKGSWWIL